MEKPGFLRKISNTAEKIKDYGSGLLRVAMITLVLESCGQKVPELFKDYVAKHPTVELMAQDQRSWLISYVKSPMYKERLTDEIMDYDPQIEDVGTVVDSMIHERIENINSAILIEGNFTQEDVEAAYDPDDHTIHYDREKTGLTKMAHEFTHSITRGGKKILPNVRRDLYRATYSKEFVNEFLLYDRDVDKLLSDGVSYARDPGEMSARINEVRFALQILGKYDPRTEYFTEEHYNFLKENFYKIFLKSLEGESGVEYIFQHISKDDFIEMMNKFASLDGPNTIPNTFQIDVHWEAVA